MPESEVKLYLDQELTYEEFQKELEDLKAWISRKPRRRGSWYFSVVQWCEVNR